MKYADTHPFSPNYKSKTAKELAKMDYSNRAHAPAEGTRPVVRGRNQPNKTNVVKSSSK